jgi:hypothetical protein
MVEALYGELDEARLCEFEDHLAGCRSCNALYGELRATVETMHRRERPDPGPKFWDGYWRRLEERVLRADAAVDASRFGWRRSIGSWGYRVAAAVLVLAAGVWIGRTVFEPAPRSADRSPETAVVVTPDPGNGLPAEPAVDDSTPAFVPTEEKTELAARPDAIDEPAGTKRTTPRTGVDEPSEGVVTAAHTGDGAIRYIGRSQVVLLALLNGGNSDGDPAGFASERAQARVLVAEGQKIRDDLTRPEDRRLRELVGQLEMILREIANLEAGSDLDAVEMIRNRVDREGVLLQIDLRQMRDAAAPGGREGVGGDAID